MSEDHEPKDDRDEGPAPQPGEAGARQADAEWAELAASLAADASPRPREESPAPAEHRVAPTGSLRAQFFGSLALVLSLVAIAVSGMLWWQYRQFYVSLDQTDAATARSVERTRADLRSLQDALSGLKTELETEQHTTASLGERLDALPGRFADLERRVDAVQGGSFDARNHWLRSEAEYYLEVANTELTLAGHWEGAIEALGLADQRLADLADPSLAPVREAIADELQKLNAVRLPDTAGLIFSLGRLAARVDELPMRSEPPSSYTSAPDSSEAEPGLGRMWLSLKRTLLGLVRVERRDAPVPQALTTAERELRRRQLQLELELARVAALRAEPQAFQSSLKAATDLLQRDFAADAADVDGALALLKQMQAVEIAPKRPDIGASLNLLRKLSAGGK